MSIFINKVFFDIKVQLKKLVKLKIMMCFNPLPYEDFGL